MKGFFLTLEGVEGAGKTHQSKKLFQFLKKNGKKVVLTREPGGSGIADKIRQILLIPSLEKIEPLCELLLYNAARVQHMKQVVEPALQQGKIVLCDRFTDATIAYQSFGRKLPLSLVRQVNQIATTGLKPDLTFLFDCPPEIGLRRANARLKKQRGKREERFEKEKIAFHRRVRKGYLQLAHADKKRFCTLDTRKPEKVVFQKIIAALHPRLLKNDLL
ncbi:MAG: dTMP kinase [bacterium]|nr:dTMP kinase [bacterium]